MSKRKEKKQKGLSAYVLSRVVDEREVKEAPRRQHPVLAKDGSQLFGEEAVELVAEQRIVVIVVYNARRHLEVDGRVGDKGDVKVERVLGARDPQAELCRASAETMK